jgi:hypothetical protein
VTPPDRIFCLIVGLPAHHLASTQSYHANGTIFARPLLNWEYIYLIQKIFYSGRGAIDQAFLTVQNVYASHHEFNWHTNVRGWRKHLWSWHIPPKIKYFTWLMTAYKLNTWDILQKKGWSGPNYCHLCHLILKLQITFLSSAIY